MLDEYSIARGWDGDGRPAPAKLERLGLTGAAVAAGIAPSEDVAP